MDTRCKETTGHDTVVPRNLSLYPTQQVVITSYIVGAIGFVSVAFFAVYLYLAWEPKPITCDSFTTQTQAQAYLADYPQLDADNDHIPCENLPTK